MTLLAAFPSAAVAETIRVPVWTPPAEYLQVSALVAKVNGEPVSIVRLREPSEDLMLLIVLDLVSNLNRIELARQALLSSSAGLTPNVYIGVLRAQDGLRVLIDPTKDRDATDQTLRQFTVYGTPGLLETVETASTLADSILHEEPVRIAVLYVTDSDIREYREDFTNPVINRSDRRDMSRRFPEGLVRDRVSKIAGTLAARQAPLFIVHLNYRTDRLNDAYQNGLMQLASTTGGQTAFCRSNSEIAPAIRDMLNTITAHYALDLDVPGNNGDSVEVSLEDGVSPLTYRSRYKIVQAGD